MSDDLVTIEVDGTPLQARKGQMLMEVTDAAGIDIPRFCYHKKLSVAANCRMCLVEVEKAPKPLPACATPVADGMKVHTESPLAVDAQKGTMEFLLINHPLDCPICDQGGECELQDVAMGYGQSISRYTEAKRVVKDQDIGPLVSTDMTRCIHCTRCVRFGEEIAGMRELGATGRGEFMEIGTYVEKALSSELSGNVIDLCPVGALNAKPFRHSGRAWEMLQHAAVGPHDGVGSNLYLHTLRGKVKRVVPRDNEAINETWIADRDRFSYLGIYSPERVEVPMVKEAGEWQVVDWETALEAAASGLAGMPPDQLGALVSPQATLEELYLAQRILRGLGSQNIDHRLRQSDFSDQGQAPLFPWLGMAVEDVESLDAALVVGSNLRKEQPILNHRLRKAALAGAEVTVVNPFGIEPNLPLADQVIAAPAEMLRTLAGMTKAAFAGRSKTAIPPALADLLSGVKPSETEREAVRRLKKGQHTAVFLGDLAARHPWLHLFRALAGTLAERTGAQLGYAAGAANTAGAWLAGALPHRGPAGTEVDEPGLHAQAMLASPRKAYLLLGVEPEMDCEQPPRAVDAMDRADFVVSLSPFASDSIRQHADVLLPVGTFAETSGTFVNLEGRWQSFEGAARPVGEARPGWKVLRVLGNRLGLRAFDYMSSQQVRDELKQQFAADTAFSNAVDIEGDLQLPEAGEGLLRLSTVPIYATDPLVRRSSALQETPDAAVAARMSPSQAEALGLAGAEQVVIEQDGGRATLALIVDDSIPEGYVWVPAGVEETSALSAGFGQIQAKQA